jgi:hypothetical protein
MSDSSLAAACPARPAAPLRMTIGLLLIWTTTTALTLGLATSLHRTRELEIHLYRYPQSFRQMLWLQDVLWFAASPAYGAALAAAAVAAGRAARQIGGFPAHPGHWIAVLLGIATVGIFAALIPGADEPGQRIVATGVAAVLAVVSCLAAGATHQPPRWRYALRVAAGGFCGLIAVIVAGRAARLEVEMPILWLLVTLPGLAIAAAVVLAGVAVLIDLAARARYDLFHWVGVLTLAVLVAHPLAALCLLRWHG